MDYVYDLVGKISQVTDPTGTYGFAYDNMGRLIGTTTQYTFLPATTFSNTYTYDAASNRKTLTAPDGSTNTYNYDTLNRLSSLNSSLAGQFSFSYDTLSRRTQLTRPNGINTNYSYDSLSRLLSVLHQAGSTTIDGATYVYDAAGNRTTKTNQLNNVTEGYTYDPLHQLTQVAQGATTTESYSYDVVGNRLSSMGVSPYTYNSSNQLTSTPSATYTYDNNGSTLTRTDTTGTRTYTWDYENRLSSVVLPGTGGTVSFKFDPFGRRIEKSSSSGTVNYVYDGANIIEEVDNGGNIVVRYTQGGIDEQFSEIRSGTTSYYQHDGLGSVTSLSNVAGTLANTYAYDSFGNVTTSTGPLINPFRYAGREFDAETSTYYYRSRFYDPTSGRFLSEDPIAFLGGMNFYAYVGNDPINWIDPTGLAKSPAECQELLKQIKALSIALGKELAQYDPIADGLGGWPMPWGSGKTKPGGHYTEMGNYAAGIANRAAVYWKECKKCDGNPSLPQWVWDPVQAYNKKPKPIITMAPAPPPIPDELVNWYDPSPLQLFNQFMNQHFGNAPAQGPVTLPPWMQPLIE